MSKKMTSGLKPGHSAPASGQYVEVGPRGGIRHEITISKGETMPPTTKPGSTFTFVDASKNQSGKP